LILNPSSLHGGSLVSAYSSHVPSISFKKYLNSEVINLRDILQDDRDRSEKLSSSIQARRLGTEGYYNSLSTYLHHEMLDL
jgi:hypothetical protein